METPEHQEWRSRQQLSMGAVIKSGLMIGLILFIMSGGSPWTTAGTMNMIMGRDIPVPSDDLGKWSVIGFSILLFGHFAVSLIYAYVIGFIIFKLKPVLAVPMGILVAIALYFLNLLVFRSAGGRMQSPEFVTFFVHVIYGLFTSLVYKAISVPPPLDYDPEEPRRA